MTNTPSASFRVILFFLFSVSGFTGLIYESIWSHYLKLMLGHAAYAQTLVLAIFMGGMALGAWLASRYSKHWSNPLLAYALVEGIIGLFAIGFHFVFVHALDFLYLDLIPVLQHSFSISLLKWSIASGLILPQSILLGMTFPLMSVGIIRLYPQTTGATLGMLYFTNSIGAAVGVLVSVFVLIPRVGLPGTILTGGILNVLLAIVVWGLVKGRAVAEPINPTPAATGTSRFATLLLLAALLSSLASFFYEIGWIRMLSLVLGSSTQAFELMLSAFITGLALGGLWIRRRIDRIDWPLHYAGHVQILMGVFALSTLPLYNFTFDFMGFAINSLNKNDGGYSLFNLSSHVIALIIMLPATFLAGMTLPLFTYALIKHGDGERSIGRIYSINTLGAILGVLLAVHLVMPALGTKGLISLGAFLDMAVGIGLLRSSISHLKRWELPASVGAAFLVLLVIIIGVQFDPLKMASGVYRHGHVSLNKDNQILYHKDGKTATVALIHWPPNETFITTNGKTDALINTGSPDPSSDEITMVMVAALPLSIYPTAKTVANIGMGSGMTTHTLLGVDTLEQVDTVEIEQAMVEAAKGFGKYNERAYSDPRSHIYIEDAKTFFSSRKARYDIIISEPSNPWVSGVASLFSEEFYSNITHYLNEKGLLVQWLQLYETNDNLLSSILKALTHHFSDYVVFNTGNTDILIVATHRGNLNRLDPWIFEQARLKSDMNRVGLKHLRDLEVRRIGNKAILDSLIFGFGAPANSDYFPYVSYYAPKSRYLKQSANLGGLHFAPIPMLELLGDQDNFNREPSTESAWFAPTTMQKVANHTAEILLSEQSPDTSILSKDFTYILRLLQIELSACSNQTPDEALVRDGLFEVAKLTNPYLSVQRLEPVWAFLASRPCFNRLSAYTKNWFALHQAASRRDGPAMAELASSLIEDGATRQITSEQSAYLLASGLSGFLAIREENKAIKFLERFNHLKLPIDNPPFYLYLLFSKIGGKIQTANAE